jgi:hypothetical protein
MHVILIAAEMRKTRHSHRKKEQQINTYHIYKEKKFKAKPRGYGASKEFF